MEASNFDLKGFLNDPAAQADKAGAIQFLQQKGIIDAQGKVIPGMIKEDTPTQSAPSGTPGSPGSQFPTGMGSFSALKSNIAAVPGAFMGAGKAAFNAVTGAEQGFGKEIAAAVGAPEAQKQADALNMQHQNTTTQAMKLSQQLKAAGKDSSKIDSIITNLRSAPMHTVGDVLPSVNDSTGQVFGNAAGVAADALGAGTYGKAAKAMETGKLAKPLIAAPTAVTLAKQGIDLALEPKSEISAISKELTPILTPTKYSAAAKAGQATPPGFFKKAGLASDLIPNVQNAAQSVVNIARQLGQKATDIVKPGDSATGNINRVIKTISSFSEKVVKPLLSSNQVPTNFENFIDYMKNVKPSEAIGASKDTAQAFNRIRDRVIQTVYSSVKNASNKANDFKSSTDLNVYWNARKTIDNVINEELGAKTFTDPSVSGIKAAAKSLRGGVADFISDALRFPGQMEKVAVYRNTLNGMRDKGMQLGSQELKGLAQQLGLNPTGEKVASKWDASMNDLSNLYQASDNLATRAVKENGKNKIELFSKNHPVLTKGLKIGAGLAGAGAIFGEGQNIAKSL